MGDTNNIIFANNLTYYMNQKGVDRLQLCEALGLKYSTVSEWLSAKKYPRMDKIELLAKYFDVKKSDLIESADQDIGSMIHERRIALDLTLEDVGKAVGVNKSTVSKWESGYISNMRKDKIEKLAKVLQFNPVRLLGINIKTTHLLQPDDELFVKLTMLYHSLNEVGKEKAVERLEELSIVPIYQKSEKEGEENGTT